MKKVKVEDAVEKLAEPIAESLGLELVDIEYLKEGGSWYLRVFIDKPEGITHDDCQSLSQQLSDLLDEKDPVPNSYILEVSSPGIERPIKKTSDFERFKGYKVRAATFSPVEGQKEFVGELEGLIDDKVILNVKGKQITLPLESVAKVRLEADF